MLCRLKPLQMHTHTFVCLSNVLPSAAGLSEVGRMLGGLPPFANFLGKPQNRRRWVVLNFLKKPAFRA